MTAPFPAPLAPPLARPFAPPRHRTPRLLFAVVLTIALAAFGALTAATPAHAAVQGAGFGAWAPLSPSGWHGSMLVDGVHTYCILPGAPAPTGHTVDRGVSATAAGLTPQQLTGINLLVTKYGQTDDPVQAAAVGWAIKAIANWHETLHHFGYPGDSLAGAIHWTFSALAPAHDEEVQRLAVAYYEEATAVPVGAAQASGRIVITTDAADQLRGTMRVDASTVAATGTLTLVGATFADSGAASRADAVPGVEYAIVAEPSAAGRPFTVSAAGRFTLANPAAVRHFTTDGGQDTAGPAGEIGFDVVGADEVPRMPPFAPTITTQVTSKYATAGPFIDDVVFGGAIEHWPRAEDGTPLPVNATAEVYRTDTQPVRGDGNVPDGAEHVGSLGVATDAATGPDGPYRVTSLWELAEPGFYTAVWSIRADSQSAEVARHLPAGYLWIEPFGEPTQITMIADVSSLAQPTAHVGDPVSDKIIVSGPIPTGGLIVTSALYRAREGNAPLEACTDDARVWVSDPYTMDSAGEHVVTSPALDQPGTYYWQEQAVDAAGELVHLGVCGVSHETTEVTLEPGSPTATPAGALAATGGSETGIRSAGAAAIALLTAGGTLLGITRRRRITGAGWKR